MARGRDTSPKGVSADELRWPGHVPEFEATAEKLRSGTVRGMLTAVWDGYDRFYAEFVAHMDLPAADAAREVTITKHLQLEIVRSLDAFSAVECVASWPESNSRTNAGPKQPEYDIAFVLRENRRVAWPLEAKVLATPGDLGEYVRDLRDQFLRCRYAPFSSGGAMLAYLLAGDPSECLERIGRLVQGLVPSEMFPDRPHRLSVHDRSDHAQSEMPTVFKCHHLVMRMWASFPNNVPAGIP